MTTRIIECFDVQQWDGGDRTNHYCFMANEKDAKETIKLALIGSTVEAKKMQHGLA